MKERYWRSPGVDNARALLTTTVQPMEVTDVEPAPAPVDVPPPRPRRDWRWGVGLAGRTLIALGVLILLFVAYQLWGTSIQHARSQDVLAGQLDHQLSTTTTAPTPAPTPTTAVAPTTVPPITTPPTTVAPPARPALVEGDAVARLEIPRIGVNEVVVEGVGVSDLKKGPGHYIGTPLPGEAGNAAIAGHRTTYGAPFGDIDKLRPGDEVDVTTYAGRFVYRVTGTQIVPPSDVQVIADTPDNRLTLTSCHPKYSAAKRMIVSAAFDPAASSLLVGGTTPTTAPAPVPTRPPNPDVVSSTPTTALAPTTTTLAGGGPAVLAAESAFDEGWFSDRGAWVDVLLWGALGAAVAVGAWYLGRGTHRWIGWLAGVLPFLFVLYFFYENVSRLLPPNI
jgi:sortase A